MRIFFMLSHDVVFKPRLLQQLLLRCPGQVVGVAEVQHGKRRNKINAPSGFSFWGVKGSFLLAMTILMRKLSSALPFPQYLRCRSTIKRTAKIFNIPYQHIKNVNDKLFLDDLKLLKPDVVVSFQHQIFKKDLLSLPALTCLNCHPAMLPKYRGVKPIFWAMFENQKQIGVTVHTMDVEIDVGYIVCQKVFNNLPNSTLMDNYIRAYDLSCDAIIESLNTLIACPEIEGLPKINCEEKYYGHPSAVEVKEFKEKGYSVI